jgi:hypothetical protein
MLYGISHAVPALIVEVENGFSYRHPLPESRNPSEAKPKDCRTASQAINFIPREKYSTPRQSRKGMNYQNIHRPNFQLPHRKLAPHPSRCAP